MTHSLKKESSYRKQSKRKIISFVKEQLFFEKLKTGDDRAFKKLHCQVYRKALFFMQKKGKDLFTAEDVIQEAFYKFLLKIKTLQLKQGAKVSDLFMGFINNTRKQYMTKKSKDKLRFILEDKSFFETPIDQELSNNKAELLHTILNDCILECNDKCQYVLMEYNYGKKSLEEIGQETGHSTNYIKTLKKRCMDKLKKSVQRHPSFSELSA